MALLVLKRASFCKTLGLASMRVARLKSLKLKVPMLAVYRVGLVLAFRKFWLKHFSRAWCCISDNFGLVVLKRNEKAFFCWEALAGFGDRS